MKRVAAVIATVLITLLSVVTPAQAVQPQGCTSPGTYRDSIPPFYTHWFMGQRTYGDGVTDLVTYRYWLHEDRNQTPTKFLATSYARCLSFSGKEFALEPVSETFGRPCTETGDYRTIVVDKVIDHRLIGARRSPPEPPPVSSSAYRFWVSESGGRYLRSDVARCW